MSTLTLNDYHIVLNALRDKYHAVTGKEKAEIEEVWHLIKDEEDELYN